jgi:hypothetical protein
LSKEAPEAEMYVRRGEITNDAVTHSRRLVQENDPRGLGGSRALADTLMSLQ